MKIEKTDKSLKEAIKTKESLFLLKLSGDETMTIDIELLKNIEVISIKNKTIYIDNIHKTIRRLDDENINKRCTISPISKSV